MQFETLIFIHCVNQLDRKGCNLHIKCKVAFKEWRNEDQANRLPFLLVGTWRKLWCTEKNIYQEDIAQNAYLVPRMSFYLWKPILCIVRIHTANFLPSWSTKYLHKIVLFTALSNTKICRMENNHRPWLFQQADQQRFLQETMAAKPLRYNIK